MKQNNLWRFILVLAIVAWSLYEIYPPTSRDLVQEFTSRAENTDADLHEYLAAARARCRRRGTNSEFAKLQDAIGTNDIQNYFPSISAKNAVVSDDVTS